MKITGISSRIFRVGDWRPIRFCSRLKGRGLPSFQGRISPSITVPSGRVAAASASSGNVPVQAAPRPGTR